MSVRTSPDQQNLSRILIHSTENCMFEILHPANIFLLVFWGLQTEMLVGPPETMQMGKPVPYCGSSHPDGKMPHKCQGKPAWLHSTHTLDTQLNNTKEKAILPYTRVTLLTACWHQEY